MIDCTATEIDLSLASTKHPLTLDCMITTGRYHLFVNFDLWFNFHDRPSTA